MYEVLKFGGSISNIDPQVVGQTFKMNSFDSTSAPAILFVHLRTKPVDYIIVAAAVTGFIEIPQEVRSTQAPFGSRVLISIMHDLPGH